MCRTCSRSATPPGSRCSRTRRRTKRKLVVEILAGDEAAIWDPRAIPAVVFTDPEIAWCGLTEADAKKQNREVKVGVFRWGFSGRASTLGRNEAA